MARTLPSTIKQANTKGVWLVEIDALNASGGTSTQYYATYPYTLSLDPSGTQVYSDGLADPALSFAWARVKPQGGLGSVGSFRVNFVNLARESNDLLDTLTLENREVRVYYLPVTGTETELELLPVQIGSISRVEFTERTMTLHCHHNAIKHLRECPSRRISPIDYPYCPGANLGKSWPLIFGNMDIDENNTDGKLPFLAKGLLIDPYQGSYLFGESFNAFGDAHQYYPPAGRYGRVTAQTNQLVYSHDGTLNVPGRFTLITNPERKIRLRPGRILGTYSVADDSGNIKWRFLADQDSSTNLLVDNLDDVDLAFSGVPKLGSFTDLLVGGDSNTTKTFDYEIFVDTTSVDSATGITDVISTTLTTTNYADWDEAWNFEIVSIYIDGTQDGNEFWRIFAELRFDDQQSQSGTKPLDMFMGCKGNGEGPYVDGGNIIDGTTLLESPPHILRAILRLKTGFRVSDNDIDITAFGTAHTARSGWKFAFQLLEPVAASNWLDDYGFQSGMHIYNNFDKKWKCVARDKTTAASHLILANHHIPIKNPSAPPQQYEYDCVITRSPVTDIINEIAIRYRLDRASNEYTALYNISGLYRESGTGDTADTGDTLTDTGATFLTDGVQVNWTCYIPGDANGPYTVKSVDSETQITFNETTVTTDTGVTYYLGPDLDGTLVDSQIDYDTENHLGRELDVLRDVGGYTSDLIGDDATTAQNFAEYVRDWLSSVWYRAEFGTFLNGLEMEMGDFLYFDHPHLPDSKRPTAMSPLNGAHNDSTTTFTVDASAGYTINNFYYVGTEAFKVTAKPTGTTLTVTRAQLNTLATSHADNAVPYEPSVKFEVIGIKPPTVTHRRFPLYRLQIQEVPA